MTNFNKGLVACLGCVLSLYVTSCKNSNAEFPDYEGGISAYFAYQYPSTKVVLGEYPDGDNSLNLDHKVMIYATQGGAYEPKDLKIDVIVDPSLTDNLTFPDGSPVQVMPESYYSLSSNTLTLSEKNKNDKKPLFGTEVTLTDAFFADPASIKNTYVIPLQIVKATGADRILSGTPYESEIDPKRCNPNAWIVRPQDYVLYCVKYVNPWDASYLRRGVDDITDADGTSRNVRHEKYREKDEVVRLTTKSMDETVFSISTVVPDGASKKTLTCDMVLKFNGDDCSISTSTPGMTASGTGKFVKLGEKKGFNNEDHNVIYLDYSVDFGPRQFATKDTLVVRSREIVPEFDFKPVYNK